MENSQADILSHVRLQNTDLSPLGLWAGDTESLQKRRLCADGQSAFPAVFCWDLLISASHSVPSQTRLVNYVFALKRQSQCLTGGLAGAWGLADLCAELWASLET